MGHQIRKAIVTCFHSLVLSIYPVVFLFEKNSFEARSSDFFQALGGVLLLYVSALCFFVFFLKRIDRASLLVTLLALITLAYGPLVALLNGEENHPGLGLSNLSVSNRELIFFPALMCFFLMLAKLSAKLSVGAGRMLTFNLNAFAAVLLAFPLLGISVHALRERVTHKLEWQTFLPVDVAREPVDLPDIYYIILDAYGREDVLKNLYQYDNSEFLDFLKSKGFYVATESHANYPVTILSLSSSLNANYLSEFVRPYDENATSNEPIARALQNNVVVKALRASGYQIVSFSSGYHPTELDSSDLAFERMRMNNFLAAASGYFQLPYVRSFISAHLHESYRKMLQANISDLPEAAPTASPKFVFCHIVAPHPPFVFKANGEPITPEKLFSQGDGDHYGSREEYRRLYIEQLRFITKEITKSIDRLLNESRQKPVIIIQGDHGPGSETYFQNPDKTNFYERLSILNAYYFPQGNYQKLYPSITPVNSFRVVFNTFFGQELPLQPDKSYFSGLQFPFRLKEVTAMLKQK